MGPHQTWPSHESNENLSRKWTQVIMKHKKTRDFKPAQEPSITREEPPDNDEAFTSMCSQFHVEDNPEDPSVNGDPFTTEKMEPLRMRQIPGYPPSSDPLPPGIGNGEIIQAYPNHLHGRVLLGMLKDWAPKDIAETSPAKEINRRMISKRIEYAKKRFDPSYKSRSRMRVVKETRPKSQLIGSAQGQGKGKALARAKALKKTVDAVPSATPPAAPSSTQRDPCFAGDSPLFTVPTPFLSPSSPLPLSSQSFRPSYPNFGSPQDHHSYNGHHDTYQDPTYSEVPTAPYFHQQQDPTSYELPALYPWHEDRPEDSLDHWSYPTQEREWRPHAHGFVNEVIGEFIEEQEAEYQVVNGFGPWM